MGGGNKGGGGGPQRCATEHRCGPVPLRVGKNATVRSGFPRSALARRRHRGPGRGPLSQLTVVNGVLLKPLPFEDPDELVGVWHSSTNADELNMTPPLYFTYRDENRAFEDVGSWDHGQVSVTGLASPSSGVTFSTRR